MEQLPAIIHETRGNPDSAVIWLHGLGADGGDFAPIVAELHLPEDLGVRFVFPHAPKIPVTVNGGMVMPAWYDIFELHIDRRVDSEGLLASADAVAALVDRERQSGIDANRIVVAGFSQGGAVAYQLALSYGEPLAGLLAMSTYFATRDSIEISSANRQLPVEIHHGLWDPVVPETLGKQALSALEGLGYHPTYRTYPMEHGVCPQQIGDISRWLQGLLAATT